MINLNCRCILLLIFCLLFFIPAKTFAQENTGSGVWLGLDLKYKFSKKIDLNFCPQWRSVISPPQFGSLLLEAGLDYSVAKNLTASAFYRYDIKPDAVQQRVYLDLSGQHKFIKKISTELRIRIQRQFGLNKIPVNYLRPKLSIKYKLSKKVSPFISGELFYHLYYKGNEFDNFRFQAGVNWDLKHSMSLKTYYLLDSEFNVYASGRQHIAGITLGKEW